MALHNRPVRPTGTYEDEAPEGRTDEIQPLDAGKPNIEEGPREEVTVSSSDANDSNRELKLALLTEMIENGHDPAVARAVVDQARGSDESEFITDAQRLMAVAERVRDRNRAERAAAEAERNEDPMSRAFREMARKSDLLQQLESGLGTGPSVVDNISRRLAN